MQPAVIPRNAPRNPRLKLFGGSSVHTVCSVVTSVHDPDDDAYTRTSRFRSASSVIAASHSCRHRFNPSIV